MKSKALHLNGLDRSSIHGTASQQPPQTGQGLLFTLGFIKVCLSPLNCKWVLVQTNNPTSSIDLKLTLLMLFCINLDNSAAM